jgi:four helix bundle protein
LRLGYRSFEDLEVWKQSCRLAVRIYRELNDCRDYGLKDQMTRAAVSIPSNIAEGAERDSTSEYIRFIHIAKGSAAELRTQIYIAGEIGILPGPKVKELATTLKQISATLQSITRTLKQRQAQNQKKAPNNQTIKPPNPITT